MNYQRSGKLAEALRKTFDCRIVTTIHHLEWCYSLLGNVSRFKKTIASGVADKNDALNKIDSSYRREKSFYEMVDHVICLSRNTQQHLLNEYKIKPEKITVIYNGLTDNYNMQEKSTILQKYNIPDNPIILFVGRLNVDKGLTYALRAFKILLKVLPQSRMLIAGNGEFEIYMKECEDIWMRVTWTGLIDKEELYDIYSIADIGVMPSFHEQCSYVAIEMMMHGVPLIVSTSTGLCEMVEEGITGLHIPVVEHPDSTEIDSSLLAEKMLYLLQNPEERNRMKVNARRRYLNEYSAPVFRQKMLDFYRSLFPYRLGTN